jgi:hypothetical protein
MQLSNSKRVGLHRLIEKLTDNALNECAATGRGEKRRPLSKSDMPGYRITQLNLEEREALSHAKPEHFSWRGFK